MFTGIIEEVGAVAQRTRTDMTLLAKTVLEDLRIGDSVAVDGVCLTVTALHEDRFQVQTSPETLARTTLEAARPGRAVNLERAMTMGGRFGGHIVQGHVDGVGRVASVTPQGDFALWRFQAPAEVARYLIPKGSIAVDGVSLTVVEPSGDAFGVAVIPTTIQFTTLSAKRAGDAVNLEADVIGKHIYHYLSKTGTRSGGVTAEFLARHGFA